MQNKEKLFKRAKRKYLNIPALKHLIDLNSPLKSAYIQTLSCSSAIQQKDGKLTSRYCKRTWCAICNPIRTAIRINNYKQQLEALNDLQMTTLTMPNCFGSEIKLSIKKFRSVFRQFRDTYKKRTGEDLKGVYNFEITFNNVTRMFHPHIHILHEYTPNYNTGEIRKVVNKKTNEVTYEDIFSNEIIDYWLKKVPDCSLLGQDTRECFDIIEGFKYQSKSIFSIKINGKNEAYIPVKELDEIFLQIRAVRCFQPFGIKQVANLDEEKQMDELTAYETEKPQGSYIWRLHDWHLTQCIDEETGEILNYIPQNCITETINLTDFKPSSRLSNLVEKLTTNIHYEQRTNGKILPQKNENNNKKRIRCVP